MQLAKVLIVDDNKDLSHALEVRLRASDYDILLADNGVSATAIALAQKPLAILLDLHLPKEDGLALLKRFQGSEELSAVPIIIVSADCSPLTQQRVFAAGAHSFLEKPVDHRLLLSTLRDIYLRSQNRNRLKAAALPAQARD